MADGIPEARLDLQEEQRIVEWLKKVRFRKKLFGGVSEKDVWKKLGELNEMYQKALIAERARYDALLAKARRANDSERSEVVRRE